MLLSFVVASASPERTLIWHGPVKTFPLTFNNPLTKKISESLGIVYLTPGLYITLSRVGKPSLLY